MPEKIRIDLESHADTSGVDKMGAAVEKTAGATRRSGDAAKAAAPEMAKAADGSKQLAGALGKNVEVGSQAVTMMTSIEGASKGGAAGLASAARAGLAFFTMLKGALAGAGPVATAVTVLAALAGGAIALAKAFKEPAESVEDFKKRIEGLDKASLAQLDSKLAALNDRLTSNREHAESVRAALDKIDDAEMAAQLAAVKNSKLPDDEKAKQEYLVREEFRRRRDTRERSALEGSVRDANERRDTLAPEYEDAKERYSDLLREIEAGINEAAEIKKMFAKVAELQRTAGGAMDPKWVQARRLLEEAKARNKALPSEDEAAKLDAEAEAARKAFEGDDGKGGIAKQFNEAAAAAKKASDALALYVDTQQKVAEWDKARVRLENNGADPRDTEAAARKSPGRARMVGPDGRVIEYDVQAAPTTNEQIQAQAEAARRGPIAPPQSTIQRGGGSLPGDGTTTDSRITQPLQDTAAAIGKMPDGSDTAKAAAEVRRVTEQQLAMTSAAAAATVGALAQVSALGSELVGVQQQTVDAVVDHGSRIASLEGAVRSLRAKANQIA